MEGILANSSYNATLAKFTSEDVLVRNSTDTGGIICHNCTESREEFTPTWAWVIVDCLLVVFILCGNILTILAVILSRKLSNLISNKFVLNLAVSDLLVGLTLPYHLAFYLDEELGTMKTTCILRFVLIKLACSASVFNLLLIAVDRYVAILYPLHYVRFMSRSATVTLMGMGWAVSLGLCMVPAFWNIWSKTNICIWHKVIPKVYTMGILVPMFGIIWLVMLVLYWKIWREAALHTERMRAANRFTSEIKECKSIQLVLLILGSFSVCWLPYIIVICTGTLRPLAINNRELYKAVFSLAMANSGINPLIYAWKNEGFRKAFLRLLHCQPPDILELVRSYKKAVKNEIPDLQRQRLETPNSEGVGINKSIDTHFKRITENSSAVTFNSEEGDQCSIVVNGGFYDDASNSGGNCHILQNFGYDTTAEQHNYKKPQT